MEKDIKIDEKVMEWKIRWALLTWALGDTLGVPTEMRDKKFLEERYWIVNDFLPTRENLFFNKYWFKWDEIWFYSDDTALTFAILKSLTEIWSIDMQDIRKKQIEWYRSFPYGFGSSTKIAFKKIEEWTPLQEITNPNGWWNGMMMKQFPLAAYFAVNETKREDEEKIILDITRVSHWHPAALVSAIVHHNLLKKLLICDIKNIDKKNLLNDLINIAQEQESKIENREWKKISEVLSEINWYIDNEWNIKLSDEEILEKFGWTGHMKNSGFITTTIGIVYCLFFRNTWMQWVWDAVNFGWDTDTYASIIWNMTGALNGEIYDEKLLNQIKNIERLKQEVNDFIFKLLW